MYARMITMYDQRALPDKAIKERATIIRIGKIYEKPGFMNKTVELLEKHKPTKRFISFKFRLQLRRVSGFLLFFFLFVNKNGFKVGLYHTPLLLHLDVELGERRPRTCCRVIDATPVARYDGGMAPRAVFPDMDDFFYDFGRARWSTGKVVRNLRITTGLEDKTEQVGDFLRCVLPLPGLCTTRLREHNGKRYFASGCMQEATGRLSLISGLKLKRGKLDNVGDGLAGLLARIGSEGLMNKERQYEKRMV
ncbi:hypothetical protein SELMODRAFT_420329 [Selaginella moellendorffii]|uniref:Uncharacterized protein n=1 Tax=Selaginella moellendorffii TaxID=88036 RepID=D8SBN1_SELML|nr:hypothetical protein SELMODRAFT_420329 [Selaginella moellendorffii]